VSVSNATLAVTQSGTWNIGTVTSITNPVAVTNAGLTNLDVALSTRLADATFTGRWVAATLDADAIVNQTTTSVHGMCYMYNGASWDRCRGATATGLLVNISNATLAVTQSGAWSTGRTWTLASGTDSVAAVQSGTWNIGTVTSITNPVTVTDGAGAMNVIVDSGTLTAVTSITNTVTVQGAKTNNNAAPGATNVGTLPCVANAAAPAFVEGNQVTCSTDLAGNMRITGSLATSPVVASTATVTQVGAVPGNVTLLAASGSRSSCMIHNESNYSLMIKMGTIAQMNSFSAMIPPKGDWTCPVAVVYRGQIDAVWEQVDGFALVTDIP
jgi:hypothetical protein